MHVHACCKYISYSVATETANEGGQVIPGSYERTKISVCFPERETIFKQVTKLLSHHITKLNASTLIPCQQSRLQ